MYQRILVPMENEHQQEQALAHVRALAAHSGAMVILAWLVPVVASGETFFTQVQVEPGSSGARRKEQGERFLAHVVDSFRTFGVEVMPRVLVTAQPPEQAIVDMAVTEGVDLIVMATLPQSTVGRFLFGSVEDKVRRRSPVPVLFVNATQPGESEG